MSRRAGMYVTAIVVTAGLLVATLALVPTAGAELTATTGNDADTGNHRIVIADDDGAHKRTLTAGESSQISPDGTKVAVIDYDIVDYAVAATRLKVLPAAGGPPIFTLPVNFFSVSWSPDSAKLLATDFSDGDDAALTDDRRRHRRGDRARGRHRQPGASLSPDMTKLAYVELRKSDDIVRGGGALKVLDLATGVTTTLRGHAIARSGDRGRSPSPRAAAAAGASSPTSRRSTPTEPASGASPASARRESSSDWIRWPGRPMGGGC